MLISHKCGFIFTKTVKTGGTSVESYFEPFCMNEGEWTFSHERKEYISEYGIIGHRGQPGNYTWYNHMPAKEIKEKIGESIWKNYFKFCVIRNPFDKLVSEFYFERSRVNRTLTDNVKRPIKRWLGKPSVLDDIDHPDEVMVKH